MDKIRNWAKRLRDEVTIISLAQKDPRVPWYARALAIGVVAYAFSPIDLIPDPIPVFGYLDDLIIIPLGVALVVKLIPVGVLEECRQKAKERNQRIKSGNWITAGVIILIWTAIGALLIVWMLKVFFQQSHAG